MPQLIALQKPNVSTVEIAANCDEDQPAPEPLAGGERSKDFKECLLLVARAHEQEVQQLTALRTENALLKKRLGLVGNSQGAADFQEHNQVEGRQVLPGTPQMEVAAPADDGMLNPIPVPNDTRSTGENNVDARSDSPESIPCLETGAMEAHFSLLGSVTSDCDDLKATVLPGTADDIVEAEASRGGKSTFSACENRPSLAFPMWQPWDMEVESIAGGAAHASIRRAQSLIVPNENNMPVSVRGIQRYISYPSSPGRLFWDLIGAMLILYDLFAIPLEAFSPPRTGVLVFMDWFTLVFWTVNMPMSIQVGFVRGGETIMDFKQIVFNYFKTWFIIDAIVVVPDWVFTLAALGDSDGGGGSPGFSKMLRVLRLVRMVRLLRLMKLKRILRSLSELIETEYASIFANIFKMILLLLVINHYIGCLWYLVGTSHDGDDTWVIYHNFHNVGWGYKYLTAFHWAITQFTPSSMHVQPQNPLERFFAILVVVFALVGFSYVVGSITGSLAQLRSMSEDTYKQFWILRRYLKHNNVPRALSGRIQRYLEHAWASQRQTLNLKNSRLFSLLSEQLQSELQYEICMPFLRVHDLFCELSLVSGMTMRRIAWTAMQRKLLATHDDLFILGECATHMYILVNGCMEYQKIDPVTLTNKNRVVQVSCAEDFISEPILWTPAWVHLGTLTAVIETEVLMLDPKRFADIIHLSPPALAAAVIYGKDYVTALNSLTEKELSDITHPEEKIESKITRSWPRPF